MRQIESASILVLISTIIRLWFDTPGVVTLVLAVQEKVFGQSIVFICFLGEFSFSFVLLNLMCFYNFFFSFHLGCVCILKHMAMHMPPLA